MVFHIGPWRYTVKIAEAELFHDGERAIGLWDADERIIWICPTVNPRRRLQVLMHELKHAHDFHYGRPADAEGACNATASFAADVMRQLLRQGGEPAVMRLGIDGISDDAVSTTASVSIGGGCVCGRRFSAGDILNGDREYDADAAMPAVVCSVYCDCCNHVIVWREAATLAGRRTGAMIGEPTFLRGAAATDWLREHGSMAGIIAE